MLPDASRLLVSAFDLHVWRDPLVTAAKLGPGFQALADPAGYRKLREQADGKATDTKNFRVFLVPAKSDTHHFWRRYQAAVDGSAAAAGDVRELLVPLRCRPRAAAPTFTAPGLPDAVAYQTVWVWPFAWASQVEVRFAGQPPLTFDQVEQAVAALKTRDATPFRDGGEPLSLIDLFRRLGDLAREDVAAVGAQPDVMYVPRRMVVGVTAAKDAEFRRFAAQPAADDPSPGRLIDDARARVVSLMSRKKLGLGEVNAIDKRMGDYGLASLGRGQFALAHPQEGAVLMLRHHGDCAWSRGGQLCLQGNVRTSLIMWAALAGLTGARQDVQNPPLVEAGREAAGLLRAYYRNPVFMRASGAA
jgi:hypothetical protein